MALQLKTVTNKLFNPALNLVRHRSRSLIPSFSWPDPFRHHRNLLASDFWDPFDFLDRYTGYRNPRINWEVEKFVSNPKDGFEVSLNVEQFQPNEVSVKVVENSILVEAKHEERTEDGKRYVSRQFTRRYVQLDGFNVNDVVSTLSSDGILTVKAPPKAVDPKDVRNIEIQQTGNPVRNLNPGQDESKK